MSNKTPSANFVLSNVFYNLISNHFVLAYPFLTEIRKCEEGKRSLENFLHAAMLFF